ncbi:helix-turn-helix domain-containing protein [Gemmobacter nectariphilus]|uniref:helix-turn-helix domain-containing protein n=1 Tax=Gemmobacter nectariphilus TaxID=220343 RepID=UPI001378D452|nr:helix-turn-helix domain-containing protein [Gemmobacter nectariphilus]
MDRGFVGGEIPLHIWSDDKARFRWLEAIRGRGALSPMARLLAHELVLRRANYKTGQCNPSPTKLAEDLGCSVDTIKRSMADLVESGCIRRLSKGPGSGRTASIVFLFQAEIVPFPSQKKGAKMPRLEQEKGAEMPPIDEKKRGQICVKKGGKNAPQNHRREPYTRAHARGGDIQTEAQAIADRLSAGENIPAFKVTKTLAREIVRLGRFTEDELWRKWQIEC